MKCNFVRLLNENALNKVLRDHRANKESFGILYISLWDRVCENLLEAIEKQKQNTRPSASDRRITVYLVDSFNMPHSFVIHNVVKVPHLVMYTNKGITSTDINSSIFLYLGLNDSKANKVNKAH